MYIRLRIKCRFAARWKWKQAFTLRTSWQHFHRSFLITIRVCKRAVFTFLHKNAIPLAHAELTGTLKNNKPYVADLFVTSPTSPTLLAKPKVTFQFSKSTCLETSSQTSLQPVVYKGLTGYSWGICYVPRGDTSKVQFHCQNPFKPLLF